MKFEITQGVKGDWTPVGKIPEEQLAETRNEDVGNFSRIYFPLNGGEESEQHAGDRQVRELPLSGLDRRYPVYLPEQAGCRSRPPPPAGEKLSQTPLQVNSFQVLLLM